MPENQKLSWLSVHLFYNEPWESFLIKAVHPYLQTIVKMGIAQSYFFIRYWERGPHIRLRVQGEPSVLQNVLKPNLKEHFQNYFAENPSDRTEPDYPDQFPDNFKWLPNNSIYFAAYEKELHRYGGKTGLALCESQFRLSTDTVLNYFLKNENAGEYQEKLGTAIRLHLGYIHSIGLDTLQAISFLEMIFENWLPRAFEIFTADTAEEKILEKMNQTIGLFAQSFEEQKEGLLTFHQNLLADLKSGEAFESAAYNHWIKENQKLSLLLHVAAEKKRLTSRENPYIVSDALENRLDSNTILLWNLFADQVHMTNNRLGINNRDEAYLAYLMMRSLSHLQI